TLAWLFLIQGVISIFGALQLRPLAGWGWGLFDGIITLILAFLIFSGWPGGAVRSRADASVHVILAFLIFSAWPGDSVQILAILVGVSLIVSGANRLALAAAL